MSVCSPTAAASMHIAGSQQQEQPLGEGQAWTDMRCLGRCCVRQLVVKILVPCAGAVTVFAVRE